jgi:hypothetical protein
LGAHDVDLERFSVDGTEHNLRQYLDIWMCDLYENQKQVQSTWALPEGLHFFPIVAERSFDPGVCLLNGQEIKMIQLNASLAMDITRPAIVPDFEVATRGRVIRFEEVTLRGIKFTVSFVQQP